LATGGPLLAAALLGGPLASGGAQLGAQTLADYDYEHLNFHGLGVDVGYLWSKQVESAPVYSVRLDLGYLGPGLRVTPRVSYWTARLAQSELNRVAEEINRLGPLLEQNIQITGAD